MTLSLVVSEVDQGEIVLLDSLSIECDQVFCKLFGAVTNLILSSTHLHEAVGATIPRHILSLLVGEKIEFTHHQVEDKF